MDAQLNETLDYIGAVLIVGFKWCGKTATAEMQDSDQTKGHLATAETKPSILLMGENPRLPGEWQISPVLWDAVRIAVNNRRETGLFILTGSNADDKKQITHSGTGRITKLQMYPMSLYESREFNGSISLYEPTLCSYLNIRKRLYVIEDVPACLEIAVFFPNATLYRPFVID